MSGRASGGAAAAGTDWTLLRLLAAASICLGVFICPAPASAYVRYLGKTGCPYAWPTRTVELKGFPRGMTDLDEAQIASAITEAAQVWSQSNSAIASCTDLDLRVRMMSPTDRAPEAQFDGENNVVFQDTSWCAPGDPDCQETALAITAVFARTWGEILDADIDVNAFTFRWGDLVSDPGGGGRQDLQNALTHEIGHLLGFDHTCYDGDPDRPRAIDHNGESLPGCFDSDLSPAVRATTMFASADPGDVSKRTLEADELQGVCATYPRGTADPLVCNIPGDSGGGGGCTIGRGTRAPADSAVGGGVSRWTMLGGAGMTLAVLGLLAGWAGTRRARAGRRHGTRRAHHHRRPVAAPTGQLRSSSRRRSRTEAAPGELAEATSTTRSSGR